MSWILRVLMLTVFVSLCLGVQATSPKQRPNILLILADDMGYGDYSMAGNPYLKTPNLDRLSQEGVSFKHFYVSPVCAPTRASLLTGRYAQRTGVRSVTNGYETMAPDETTLAEVLSSHGYRTGLFGKWHLGENYPSLPNAQGFQEFIGFRTGHFDTYFDPVLERNGHDYPTKGYITDVLTDEAIGFMRKKGHSSKQTPFFCYLPYNAPHTPLEIAERYVQKFRNRGLSESTARVYGMIENLDENVGRLLLFLAKEGLSRNTIVIFLSDNGPMWRNKPDEERFNARLRDKKFTVYEGGIRTQCFIRWPQQIAAHRTVETVAAHIDLMPTLLDLSGFSIPPKLAIDGRSLVPLLQRRSGSWPERTLFLNYSLKTLAQPALYPGSVVRTQTRKLVNGTELYDLTSDPGETASIAAREPRVVYHLDSLYGQWWHQTNAQRGFGLLPVGVGYRAEPTVWLTPHLGQAISGLQFVGDRGIIEGKRVYGQHPTGVDGDWATNWHTPDDVLTWQINVIESGTYRIALELRGSGSALWQVSVGVATTQQSIQLNDPQRWISKPIGILNLIKGKQTLLLRTTGVGSDSQFDVKRLKISKLTN